MQFKNPELLYALFLLLIPILIHLFQLRKFKKVPFTNVAFLKKVNIQTRKSSQLKKWLTLLARLCALAAIIMAFAQPFTASKSALSAEKETVLYLDNSFSMQAKGPRGPLLKRAIQDIYDNVEDAENFSWFTNDFSRTNTNLTDFKNEVLRVDYSTMQLSPKEILLKANQLFSKKQASEKQLIVISDFQQKEAFPEIPDNLSVNAVQLAPVTRNNISIDSVYIASKSAATTKVKVAVTAQGEVPESTPVSLSSNTGLIAKSAATFNTAETESLTFDIENPEGFRGELSINDPTIEFDNTLYFNINAPEKIKVLAISQSDDLFLKRIFQQTEFEFIQQTEKTLNYNSIPSQNFVILNELEQISSSLTSALKVFVDEGGSLFFIPSTSGDLQTYNGLLGSMDMGTFLETTEQEKKVTQIIYDHPLYQDVFQKRVANFQYPMVNAFFPATTNASVALRFADNSPFIMSKNGVFVATASLNSDNSNFQSSPLIVPTLYNMAQMSLPLPQLYYEVGKQNKFSVPVSLIQDEILTLRDSSASFIPLQQTRANQVAITTTSEPATAGVYDITKNNKSLQQVSYNYNRDESNLIYLDPKEWQAATVYNSVPALFEDVAEANNINQLWKWFAIFAFLFLLIEMLLLKYYKN